jgi:ammonia channel protein AmtB
MAQCATGALAGLVSISAGCSVIEPWAAIVAGGIGGCIYVYGSALLEWCKIDDPVGAFPVHGGSVLSLMAQDFLHERLLIDSCYLCGSISRMLPLAPLLRAIDWSLR